MPCHVVGVADRPALVARQLNTLGQLRNEGRDGLPQQEPRHHEVRVRLAVTLLYSLSEASVAEEDDGGLLGGVELLPLAAVVKKGPHRRHAAGDEM